VPLNNSQLLESPDRPVQQIIDFVCQRAGEAWLVGGYVRDRLLQRETSDIDFVVPDGAIPLARTLADEFSGHFFVLDKDRDIARAVVKDGAGRRLNVDIARLRAKGLTADLRLRDFTINAIALPVGAKDATEAIDPFRGQVDLSDRVIRVVTQDAFRDDPLRLLRAVRQAAELDFRTDELTYGLIRKDAALLRTVAAERVRDELARILSLPRSWHSLRVMQEAGLLVQVLPEAAALVGVLQSAPHHQDVFDHTCSVLAHLEGLFDVIWLARPSMASARAADAFPFLSGAAWAELAEVVQPYSGALQAHMQGPVSALHSRADCLRWAALAHDWGKPATRSVDESGRIRFFGHDELGALLAKNRLHELRMSTDEAAYVGRLVGLHMRPGQLSNDYPASRRAMYRFFREAAGSGPDCVLLSLADYSATRAGHRFLEPWGRRLKTAESLLGAHFLERATRVDPVALLNGRQLMANFGLAPGPQVGFLLEGLREAQAVGEVTCYEEALAWLSRQIAEGEQ
jgi:poly(A) polymerase